VLYHLSHISSPASLPCQPNKLSGKWRFSCDILKAAFAEEHWLLTDKLKSRRKAWHSCLHFLSIFALTQSLYNHLEFQEEQDPQITSFFVMRNWNYPQATTSVGQTIPKGWSNHLIVIRLLPSSDDIDNNFSKTLGRRRTELKVNQTPLDQSWPINCQTTCHHL
jgi:hypothetical protein